MRSLPAAAAPPAPTRQRQRPLALLAVLQRRPARTPPTGEAETTNMIVWI